MAIRSTRRPRPLVLMMGLLLGGCSWTAGDQYFIHWGTTRTDVVIRERPSFDLTIARDLFFNNNDIFADEMGGFRCHADRSWKSADRCVMALLNARASIPELASGIWERATSDDPLPGQADSEPRLTDFREALSDVVSSADDELQVASCLTLSEPAVGGPNWTTRSRSHGDCRIGKHTWD